MSRVLSWFHSLNVVAIDSSESFTKGADQISQEIRDALNKKEAAGITPAEEAPSVRKGRLFHISGLLDPSMDPKQFESFLSPALDQSKGTFLLESDLDRIGIVGLHCCGDLTPTMMKMFIASEKIRTICCVGCCYYRMQAVSGKEDGSNLSVFHLSLISDSAGFVEFLNFPMSKSVRSSGIKVTWEALRAACESVEQWEAQTLAEYDDALLDSWRRFYLDSLMKLENKKRFNCNCGYSLRRFHAKAKSFSSYVDTCAIRCPIYFSVSLMGLLSIFFV